MKRFLWIVLMFLAGCGGGSTPGGNSATAAGTGTLLLQVAQQQGGPATKSVTALEAVQPTRLRIVVTNRELSYRKIVDVALGESFETVTLPAAAGYQAELVYYRSGTPNQVSHYGVATGIDIISESTTLKAATMNPIQVSLAVPERVTPGVPYDVAEPGAKSVGASALQPQWSLAASTSPFASRVHLAQAPASVHTGLTSPLVAGAQNIYFQGEFFLKPELLDENEKWTEWVFIAESAAVPLNVGYIILDFSSLVERQKPVVTSVSVPRAKLPTGLIAPIGILADDNGAIGAYMITETDTPPAPQDPGWLTDKPASYSYAPGGGLPHGQDVPVTLYVWVKDYCGNVSELTAGSHAKVIINDSAL